MVVTELPSRQVLGLNQRTYQRLKLTLQLNLKRQLLIAVCDDIPLRDRLAAQLETDITASAATAASNLEGWQDSWSLERLSLDLNPPHLPQQIVTCLKQSSTTMTQSLSLQVVGIEQLTRQSATTQRQFLRSLRQIELLLPALEHSLLLWMPWPWARLIQQSVPGFWACHTGLFEFVGDPSPLESEASFSASPRSQPGPIQPPAAAVDSTTPPSGLPATEEETDAGDSLPEVLQSLDPVREIPLEELELAEAEATLPDLEEAEPTQGSQTASAPAESGLEPHSSRQEKGATAVAVLPKPASPAQQSDPAAGNAYLQLGQAYRDRLVAGETEPELIVAAIQAYEEGLRWLPQHSALWSDSLNDLGSLYWIKAQRTSTTAEALSLMEKAVGVYQQALSALSQKTPEATGRLYSNLAAAHSFLANFQTSSSHLKQAIEAYHHALSYRPAATAALEYSSLQNSLGAAHWRLSQQELPKQHLQQAILAYAEALNHCQPQQEPLRYAMIANNLGVAYWSLAQHEQPAARLEQAIEAYQKALVYRTPEIDPAACASTHNNLGTAYCELANHRQPIQQRDQLWQKAIAAYTQTLQIAQTKMDSPPTTAQPLDVYAVHYSLGVVHGYLGASAQFDEAMQAEYLAQGLQHYLTALQGWQALPESRATALQAIANNLKLHHQQLGVPSQQQALQRIPAALLPELLPRL